MTLLSEIMTPAVKAVNAEATLKDLAEFFMEENVSGAPVLSSDRLVGVVSVTDLIEFDAEEVEDMRKDDIRQCTRDLLLVERAREWLLEGEQTL
jgi:predicted transcriptional regulator